MKTPRTLHLHESVISTTVEIGSSAVAVLDAPAVGGRANGRVLMVPGFGGSKEDFGALLPLLSAAGWHAAAYDARGQYESPAGTLDPTLDGWAADALTVAETHFGIDERIHLVGHSFGGLVARAAVLAAPERWASLTLLCSGPAALEGQREGLTTLADVIEHEGLEAGLAQVEREEVRRHPDPEPVPADVQGFVRDRFLANDGPALASIARILASADDLTDALRQTGVATAVVRGVDDDRWPHDVQDAMAERLGTSVVVIPDAAHSPSVENPELCRDALARHFMAADRA